MAVTANIKSYTFPAGTYYIGDPCYAIPNDRWMEWLEAADYTNQETYLVADLDGHTAIGVGTAYGDGVYGGSDGNTYGVDAGLIGAVPREVAEEGCSSNLVTFDSPFDVSYDEGVIRIGHIRIDTSDEEGN